MERILLVEPNYKNKYPPIGLMKISTYYKAKGDYVEFHKGLLTSGEVADFDKVLITTLFTFDFDVCIQTIQYYIAIVGCKNVFVGGIAATIMPEKFLERIPNLNLLTGQLTSATMLGYSDNTNIDLAELDYDMLWDVDYDYPAADSYFIYTTRGCPRQCSFCAVKTLEPNFYDCNNIIHQIESVDKRFGVKRNLLVMDNNVLYSSKFKETVDILCGLGFGATNNKIKKNDVLQYYLTSLCERINTNRKYIHLLNRIKMEFKKLTIRRIRKLDLELLDPLFELIESGQNDEFISTLISKSTEICEFFKRYHYHQITRYVDFNQGLDARLFSNEKAVILSKLAVRPCRIAFDNMNTKDEYFSAMEAAVTHGIRHFSNYLLYNYDERPEDLWTRLCLNISFSKKYKHEKITLFSFPMRYAAIDYTDRSYIGPFWNKKFLRAINVILNVTSGVVAKEEEFFFRAYGQNEEEYKKILTMPDDFIRYRDFFDDIGLTSLWEANYNALSDTERTHLLDILSMMVEKPEVLSINYSSLINDILPFYSLSKKKVKMNMDYYVNMFAKRQSCNEAV